MDPRGPRGYVAPIQHPEEESDLVLECADCGYIARSIVEAEGHEIGQSLPDEPHGGWDTKRLIKT